MDKTKALTILLTTFSAPLFATESQQLIGFDGNVLAHFSWNMEQRIWTNETEECRVLVVKVSAGNGYDQIWFHKAQAAETFKYPPYSNSSTWVTTTNLGAQGCDDPVYSWKEW